MSVTVELRVLELLASRVCHDLISPIGAVGNGLELIEESGGDTGGDALQLSVNCVKRASALLEFFRMAYGTAGGDGSLRWDAARGLASGLLNGSKVALVWPPMPTGLTLPPGATKLLLNLVLLATDTLPRGGEIAVGVDPAGNRLTLAVTASGRDARVTEEMAAALRADTDGVAELTAKTVQGYFAACVARALGSRLEVSAVPSASVRIAAVVAAG